MVQAYVVWFLLAFALLAAELATGTFYLLVLGIAAAAGGAAAFVGFELPVQVAITALVAVAGVLLIRRWKASRPAATSHDDYDIGQRVSVLEWRDHDTARVSYRGSAWDAELESPDVPRDKPLFIVDRRGSTLIISDKETKAQETETKE